MTSANAVRYSGVVAIAGGLLLGVGWIGDPDRLNALFGALIIAGHLLIILAMVGLYDRYRRSIGWMGQLGLVLAVAGNALYIALVAITAYVRLDVEGVVFIQQDILEADRMAAFSPIGPSIVRGRLPAAGDRGRPSGHLLAGCRPHADSGRGVTAGGHGGRRLVGLWAGRRGRLRGRARLDRLHPLVGARSRDGGVTPS